MVLYADTHYEDAFRDVMVYNVIPMINAKGVRIRIKDKDDLRILFEKVNELEKRKKTKKGFFAEERMSPDFIDRVLLTERSDYVVNKIVGKRGPIRNFKQSVKQQSSQQTTFPAYQQRQGLKPSWYYLRDARGRFKKRGS